MLLGFRMRVCLLVSIFAVSFGGVAHAASIVVNDTNDELNTDGSCSLREAIEAANTDTAVDGCAAGNGADVITLPAGTYTLAITGGEEDANATGDLDIYESVELVGAGASTTTIDADGIDRAIQVYCIEEEESGCLSAVNVRIAGVTITGGSSSGLRVTGDEALTFTLEDAAVVENSNPTDGGGFIMGVQGAIRRCLIENNEAGPSSYGGGLVITQGGVVVEDTTVRGNTGAWGGGLWANGMLTMVRTTVSGNTATGEAGGVLISNSSATLTNVTISGNTAMDGDGGGIECGLEGTNDCHVSISHSTIVNNVVTSGQGGGLYRSAGQIKIKNSIVAGNTATSNPDVSGAFFTYDYNIIGNATGADDFTGQNDQVGVDPDLGPLMDNGGYTETHALSASSAARDTGACTDPMNNTVDEDQRGISRPAGGDCDIGAFEYLEVKDLVQLSDEDPGDECAYGGVRVDTGTDSDASGDLTGDEIVATQYVCNGADSLVSVSTDVGTHCDNGGLRIDSGVDDDGDGELESGEIDSTEYVCAGADGAVGGAGAPGEDGTNGKDAPGTLFSNGMTTGGGCAVNPRGGAGSGPLVLLLLGVCLGRRRRTARR